MTSTTDVSTKLGIIPGSGGQRRAATDAAFLRHMGALPSPAPAPASIPLSLANGL